MSNYLIFYSDCLFVKGYYRGLMYDLTRPFNIAFLPNELADFIKLSKKLEYNKLVDYFSSISAKETTQEIVSFVLDKDYAFVGNDFLKTIVKEIDLAFDHSSIITNAIIDVHQSKKTSSSDGSILFEDYLGKLGCFQLHINVFEGSSMILDYIDFESLFENISIKFIGVESLDINGLEKLASYNQVNSIEIFEEIGYNSIPNNEKIKLVNKKYITLPRNSDDLELNITLFSESQAHHTYFNRKLYIGPNGEIKNAPECPETFGYIQDLESPEELKAIVQTPEFQKYWFVHKEITDVCKDCEFRHMCVDNRLPFQRAENEWYHQTECNYNPYIAKWQGEEGYRNLAECGVISNENGFSIDHEKIAEINKELWGEDED